MKSLEARIEALEAKVSFQDETIEILNDELKNHQQNMAKIRRQIELVGEKLKEVQSGNSLMPQEQEPPPPHY